MTTSLNGSARLGYRRDIDGLRAIAVLSVVLYHARVPGFAGGFVGVDVFFVISGFLISRIILDEAGTGSFSIRRFYERRIRRIFPALVVLLGVVSVVSTFLLMPEDLSDFGKSLLSTAVFVANHHFLSTAGYFDAAAHTKPLLHMWSLSVEEQFYLVFPLVVVLLQRYSPRRVLIALVSLTVVSLAVSAVLIERRPDATFYLLPTRAWELLLGSLLATNRVPAPRSQTGITVLGGLGLVGILTAVVAYGPETSFPGLAAALPCVGAFAVILAGGSRNGPATGLLSRRPFVAIGLISYSLYLWHWPLLAFPEYVLNRPLDAIERTTAVIVATVVAWASWRFVEQPGRMRIGRNQSGTITLSLGVVSMSLCAALGAIFLRSGGLPNRFDPMVTQIGKVRNERFGFACVPYPAVSETPFSNSCRLGSTDQRAGDFLLWGDSHARQYSALVSEDANRTGRVGVAATLGNCPPLHGMIRLDHPTPRHCAEFNEDVLGYLASHPEVKTVILSGIWAVYAEGTSVDGTPKGPFVDVTSASVPRMRANVFETGIRRMTQALVGLGRQVYIIGPSPEPGWDVPAELQRSIAYGKNPPTAISLDVFHARQRMVLRVLDSLESVPGVSVIYPHRALCSEGACRYRNDGDPLYFDGNHLSAAGVRAAFPQGLPMFAPR